MPSTEPADPDPDPAPRPGASERRIDAATATGVGALALVLYLVTLCPTVFVTDSPELTAAAGVFGVPHSPGYPLFTFLYGSFAAVVPLDLALACNVLTALLSATAVSVVFLVARELDIARPAAAAGALGIAVARDWWVQAVSTEVYALDGLLVACALLATVRVTRDPWKLGRWVALGLAYGLGCGHRPVNVVFLAGLLVCVERARRSSGVPLRAYARFVVAGLATTVVYLYLPLAASRGPARNYADPVELERFRLLVTSAHYTRHFASTTAALSIGRLTDIVTRLPLQTPLVVAAAAVGGLAWWKRSAATRWACVSLLLLLGMNVAFASIYNVPDAESFLQPTFVALGVLGAAGAGAAIARVGSSRAVCGAVLLLAVAPVGWSYRDADISRVDVVETLGGDLLACAPENSLILAYDDTARHAMMFEQIARGTAPSVAVVSPSAQVEWQRAEVMKRTPAYPMTAEGGGWIHREAVRLLSGRGAGVFATDFEGIDFAEVFGPELAGRITWLPSGLLYRIVVLPPDRTAASALRTRIVGEAGESFWAERAIPRPDTARREGPLGFVSVRYARSRFLLAVSHVLSGRVDIAVPHLTAIADSDVDGLEDEAVADLASAGAVLPRWSVSERSRRGLVAIASGASVADIRAALAPLPSRE